MGFVLYVITWGDVDFENCAFHNFTISYEDSQRWVLARFIVNNVNQIHQLEREGGVGDGKLLYRCTICGKEFPSHHGFSVHFNMHKSGYLLKDGTVNKNYKKDKKK